MSEECNHQWEGVDNLENLFQCKECSHMKLITTYTGRHYGTSEMTTYVSYLKPVAVLHEKQLVIQHHEYRYEEVQTTDEEKESE